MYRKFLRTTAEKSIDPAYSNTPVDVESSTSSYTPVDVESPTSSIEIPAETQNQGLSLSEHAAPIPNGATTDSSTDKEIVTDKQTNLQPPLREEIMVTTHSGRTIRPPARF